MVIPAVQLDQLSTCRRCRGLAAQLKRLRRSHPDYWNLPVPPSGPADAALLILGLAPGMHGANRTGVPFTGDASGDLLFRVLERLGIESAVRITNAVKCLPVRNLPSTAEVQHCNRFLAAEIPCHATILVLGTVAHRAALKALGETAARFPFKHGARHAIGEITLVDSYHCSRYNINTGRMTEDMLQSVVELAATHAGLINLTHDHL